METPKLKDIKDRAMLMEDSYRDEAKPPEGFHLMKESHDDKTGFFARAYFNDESKKVVIAFRGTELNTLNDLKHPVDNILMHQKMHHLLPFCTLIYSYLLSYHIDKIHLHIQIMILYHQI